MAQVSYGTITITDITDIDNIQNYYLATSASSGVTTSTSGWTTGIQSMTSTNQYLWNYEQILGTGGVVINTTTPVIIGRYGQNGQPGVSITSIDEYYKANNSSTTKPTSWNAVNVIDKPTASNKYLWNYQVIHYSNNTTEGSASEARIIGVYGDKGEKGDNGISPTVSKSGSTVTITDAEGNTVTVSDGTNGTSYYTHIRYATSSAGANMTSTPTSSTIYIGIYSGTSATAPTTANSYTWSKYMGTDGTNGISVIKVTPIYYLKTSSGSAPTAPNSGTAITSTSTGTGVWTTAIPTYVNGGTYYTSTQTYLSGGTSPVSSTAVIDQALTTANSNAYGAYNVATGINQHFWSIESDYATGIPAGSYITDTIIDTFKLNKTGGNLLTRSDGIWIRNGIQTLASLTGDALQFYNPSDSNHPLQLSIGANGTLQSGNYNRGTDSKFSSNGTKIDLVNGDIITKYFRISQGLETGLNAGAYIHGTVEALDGRIGADSTNYWEISKFTDYNLSSNATMIGHGGSFIQLGDSSTWRLATNRIHTGWYSSGDTVLHYPEINSKYWDFGIHAPTVGTDKFLYIRSSKSNTSASNALQNLLYDIDDTYSTAQWDYKFYIDVSGNVHSPSYYIINDDGTEQTLSGSGLVASSLSCGTVGSLTQPVYFNNGVPATTTYALNAAGAKGVVTNIANNASSIDLPTTAAVVNYVTSRGYITSYTDNKVLTELASNNTTFYIAGPINTATTTGTLKVITDAKITVNSSGKATITATTFSGSLSGTASRATADSDGNTIKTTYLKLSGGNVTGAVSFGSSVSADELTVGDLVVNGAVSFTNNLQANTINGVAVGSNPKFTDTNYYHTSGSWGGTNSLTYTATANGGAGALAFTLATASTTVYGVTKLSDAIDSTSTILAATANAVKKAYDLAASKTSNTGTVTSVKVQGSNGLTGSGTVTTSGTITISHADTSTQSSSSNSGRTYIQSITLDDYGHVTGLSTATETVTNTHNTAYLYAGASNGTANAATTNGNTYLILMDGGSATTRRKISGSGTVGVTSDANGNITITGSAHPTALNGVSFADGVIIFTKTDGSNTTIQTSNFVITQASGATALVGTDTNHTPLSVNGPVKFDDGVPVTMRPSTSTGLFLKDDGTWATPSTSGSATNDSDGNPINTTYIKKSIGTAAGDIIYWSESGTPTRLAKGSNGQVLKMVNNVPAWSTDNNTWDALSTSQAGYVAKAPNDTAKFLRGDASWAAVTKSNVGLGSVDNTADANKRVKGANITTTANAVAYYTDTTGTFGSKASANGALYATSANGALTFGTLPIAQGGTGKTTALAAITNLGGPYILAQGTEITASSNLDSGYKTMGTYYSPDSTRSNTLAGTCPFTGSGFKMITAIGYRGATIRQFAGGASNNLYYRSSQDTGSTWTKWYELVLLPSGSDNKTFAAVGESTTPVYVNSSGVVTACTSYANATVGKSNKTDAADLTTTANAIAYYTDTAGTFGSKASANGALYATSTGGALNWGTLPVAQGGTGATSFTANSVIISGSTTTSALTTRAITNVTSGAVTASTNLVTANSLVAHVANKIAAASDTYVTIATDQIITANQKTFSGAIRWGTTSKYGAAHYDSTLEAIVFSFA